MKPERILIIITGIIIIEIIAILSNYYHQKAITECIDRGNLYSYCVDKVGR